MRRLHEESFTLLHAKLFLPHRQLLHQFLGMLARGRYATETGQGPANAEDQTPTARGGVAISLPLAGGRLTELVQVLQDGLSGDFDRGASLVIIWDDGENL